jgi:hypothetical protein
MRFFDCESLTHYSCTGGFDGQKEVRHKSTRAPHGVPGGVGGGRQDESRMMNRESMIFVCLQCLLYSIIGGTPKRIPLLDGRIRAG